MPSTDTDQGLTAVIHSYTPWFQHDAWFSDPGKSEHVAGGSNRDELLRVLESRSYTVRPRTFSELRGMVQSDSLPLRSLYDKDSDFESVLGGKPQRGNEIAFRDAWGVRGLAKRENGTEIRQPPRLPLPRLPQAQVSSGVPLCQRGVCRGSPRVPARAWSALLSAYAPAPRCRVLTQRVLLPGSYKIAPPRKGGPTSATFLHAHYAIPDANIGASPLSGGGLRFEILDALVRCYHKMGALSGPDAQVRARAERKGCVASP
eukprot:3850832-Rhodomonas_salina.1